MRLLSYLFLGLTMTCLASQPAMAQENGESLLNEAVELKLDAKTPRDLDKVADLCEEAIEAGLEEKSLSTATQLWASACLEHAKNLSRQVFSPRPDRRWKFQRQQALDTFLGGWMGAQQGRVRLFATGQNHPLQPAALGAFQFI